MKPLFALFVCLCAQAAFAACSATPQLAVQSALSGVTAGVVAETGAKGFRVVDVLSDPLTHQAWLRVESCDAPHRPKILVPLHLPVIVSSSVSTSVQGSSTQSSPTTIAIRAGETVRLTWRSASSQMQVDAVAEGSGRVGEVISARIASLDPSSNAVRHIRALVQGPGEVVYQP